MVLVGLAALPALATRSLPIHTRKNLFPYTLLVWVYIGLRCQDDTALPSTEHYEPELACMKIFRRLSEMSLPLLAVELRHGPARHRPLKKIIHLIGPGALRISSPELPTPERIP